MKSNGKRDAELARLRQWNLLIVRFIGQLQGVPNPVPKDIVKQFEDVIEGAYKQHNLRGLRILSKDTLEWAQGLSIEAQRELDDLLRSETGSGLLDVESNLSRQIERVLKRGEIRNEGEYALLSRRAEQIAHEAVSRDELEKINKLLRAFDESESPRKS